MSAKSWHELPLSNTANQVLAESSAEVAGLPVSVLPIPGQCELLDNHHETARIFVAQQGYGKRWAKRGLRTFSMHTAPRMIEVYEKGLAFEREVWEGEQGRCTCITFADEHVQALTHGEMQSLSLNTRHELFDSKVSDLTLEVARQTMAGLPDGRLYVQGLTLSLLGLMAERYSTGTRKPALKTQTLSARQMHILAEVMHHNLSGDLSIDELARHLGMSAHHFARLFKASYGVTPHRYIQTLRLNTAAETLAQHANTPIAVVAATCGFSSQSHLTELMKRNMGITPAELRRSHKGAH